MRIKFGLGLLVAAGLASLTLTAAAGSFYDPRNQPSALRADEARAVYLGNLARRANGQPPVRWNRALTYAARWFGWDSVENRSGLYCGHIDTLGNDVGARARLWGYKGVTLAENSYCSYLAAEAAISGWMNFPAGREVLLDPQAREVGIGYYRQGDNGAGYVTQSFGHDPAFPPAIINNEALTTTTSAVDLYIYDRDSSDGVAKPGSASQMQVNNEPCFENVSWEPFATAKSWQLASGEGWRTVYVRTRDTLNRTLTVSDTIYLGAALPVEDTGEAALSGTQSQITLYNLNGGGLPFAQFSLGWQADDTAGGFALLQGRGERVDDLAAWGGTAYRLGPPGVYTQTSAWLATTDFIKDTPLVAYFRLKVTSNATTTEVARVWVNGGGIVYGPLVLHGSDFTAAGQFQEFPLAFTFNTNADPQKASLAFEIARSGATDVFVDAVSIFTAPQTFGSPFSWAVPGGNYRGQGVWVRYTDSAGHFSDVTEATVTPPYFAFSPAELVFLTVQGDPKPAPIGLSVSPRCKPFGWTVTNTHTWLTTQVQASAVQVSVDPTGLTSGTYGDTVTLTGTGEASSVQANVPVRLVVADHLYADYLPLLAR